MTRSAMARMFSPSMNRMAPSTSASGTRYARRLMVKNIRSFFSRVSSPSQGWAI